MSFHWNAVMGNPALNRYRYVSHVNSIGILAQSFVFNEFHKLFIVIFAYSLIFSDLGINLLNAIRPANIVSCFIGACLFRVRARAITSIGFTTILHADHDKKEKEEMFFTIKIYYLLLIIIRLSPCG